MIPQTLYPATKKQDPDGSSSEASTTPMTMSPDMSQSSLATPYSQSSSPQPGHPSPPPTDQSYFSFHPPNYPRTQYISGSLDTLDNSYVTATSLSSAGAYDVLLPSHTTTPTPSPLISTPHDSPHLSGGSSMSLQYPSTAEQYIEPSHSLYQSSLMDHEAYGGGLYSMGPGAYDSVDYHPHGMKISPGPDLHDSHAYL